MERPENQAEESRERVDYTLIESGVLETMKPGTIKCLHPFMEGNGRSTRIWLDLILKKKLGLCIDWSKIGKRDYLNAQQQVLK